MTAIKSIPLYKPSVIVDTTGLTEDQWLEYRRGGIGGSDAAAILGLSPFCTAREIFYDKTGIKPAIEKESNLVQKKVGHLLEDLVAEIFSQKTGLKVRKDKHMYAHPLYPFIRANVDYIVEMPDNTLALLECKTCSYNAKDKWADGAIPLNYELQCRHYMCVMNINVTFIACLFGNSETDFVYRRVDRDEDYESNIIAEERYFWTEYVQKGIEPPYTESGDLVLESIRRYYGNGDMSVPSVQLDSEDVKILDRYLELRSRRLELDRQADKLDDEMKRVYAPLIERMGGGCSAECLSGGSKYTVSYKPYFRMSINKESLEKFKVLRPDVYNEYVSGTESRRFSVSRKEIKEDI